MFRVCIELNVKNIERGNNFGWKNFGIKIWTNFGRGTNYGKIGGDKPRQGGLTSV
jgi:hypothetical protein